jgi:IS5 family transposase
VEVLLRLLLLKHLYQWSYQETQEQVDQNLILRGFCRLYWEPTPDDTTLIRWANTLQPETLHTLNDRVVALARRAKVTNGRKLRLDATCVQTDIHHPTDSGLLVDSVRVLSRLVKQAKGFLQGQVSQVEQLCRSRLRTARRTAQTLHRQLRRKGEDKEAEQKKLYQKLVETTEQMVRQARTVVNVLNKETQELAQRLVQQAEQVLPLVERVITQTRRRVLENKKMAAGEKVLSLFEPHTRAIPRHKGGALVEFGRQVMLDEVEGGIVTRYAILEHPRRPRTGDRSGGSSSGALCSTSQFGRRGSWCPLGGNGGEAQSCRGQAGGDPDGEPPVRSAPGAGADASLSPRVSASGQASRGALPV